MDAREKPLLLEFKTPHTRNDNPIVKLRDFFFKPKYKGIRVNKALQNAGIIISIILLSIRLIEMEELNSGKKSCNIYNPAYMILIIAKFIIKVNEHTRIIFASIIFFLLMGYVYKTFIVFFSYSPITILEKKKAAIIVKTKVDKLSIIEKISM